VNKLERRFYLVDAQVLPEVFLKVVRAKELLATTMFDLYAGARTLFLDRLGEPRKPWNVIIAGYPKLAVCRLGTLVVDECVFADDQSRTAARNVSVVADKSLRDAAVHVAHSR
jgi:hypothetical protein